MGIEPKNHISLSDSTPLAAVTRSNPPYQYPILDYSWTTSLQDMIARTFGDRNLPRYHSDHSLGYTVRTVSSESFSRKHLKRRSRRSGPNGVDSMKRAARPYRSCVNVILIAACVDLVGCGGGGQNGGGQQSQPDF